MLKFWVTKMEKFIPITIFCCKNVYEKLTNLSLTKCSLPLNNLWKGGYYFPHARLRSFSLKLPSTTARHGGQSSRFQVANQNRHRRSYNQMILLPLLGFVKVHPQLPTAEAICCFVSATSLFFRSKFQKPTAISRVSRTSRKEATSGRARPVCSRTRVNSGYKNKWFEN